MSAVEHGRQITPVAVIDESPGTILQRFYRLVLDRLPACTKASGNQPQAGLQHELESAPRRDVQATGSTTLDGNPHRLPTNAPGALVQDKTNHKYAVRKVATSYRTETSTFEVYDAATDESVGNYANYAEASEEARLRNTYLRSAWESDAYTTFDTAERGYAL